MNNYEVCVQSPEFKFGAAHFVAYHGYRERLHGHGYNLSLKLCGTRGVDGYVVDFSVLKKAVREFCKEMNEYVLIPIKSNVLQFTEDNTNLFVTTESGDKFSFPLRDVKKLPIMHTTAEEIATFAWFSIRDSLTLKFLKERNVEWMEATIAEAPTQSASFRRNIAYCEPLDKYDRFLRSSSKEEFNGKND